MRILFTALIDFEYDRPDRSSPSISDLMSYLDHVGIEYTLPNDREPLLIRLPIPEEESRDHA